MAKRNHNNITDTIVRYENENFNQEYIRSRELKFSEVIISDSPSIKEDSVPCMTAWLKNIDRLMDLLPKNCNLEDYRFLDVGCGAGISTLYVEENYKFKTYAGFDFEPHLVNKAKVNKDIVMGGRSLEVDFFVNDASEFILPQKRTFLFLFNPFGESTMNEFLLNNLETMQKTNSIMGYVNDLHIDIFDKLGCVIRRNSYFNLSLIEF